MIEHTQKVDADSIEVLRPVAPGENVIQPGEDINEGDLLFARGHALRPQDIGGLMSLGIIQVEVAAKPRVAIISTGDEVVSPEETPLPGQIRDVNSYTIAGVVTQAGGIPLLSGVVGDQYEVLLAAARAALERADVLVISAGSSVSSRDLTAAVINELGSPGVIVHGVAVKPGKPTILGVCGGKPVLGLPGNPVSAMGVASLFLAPLLAHLQGTRSPPRVVEAKLTRNVSLAPGARTTYQSNWWNARAALAQPSSASRTSYTPWSRRTAGFAYPSIPAVVRGNPRQSRTLLTTASEFNM